jgi:MoxR-like ATPase
MAKKYTPTLLEADAVMNQPTYRTVTPRMQTLLSVLDGMGHPGPNRPLLSGDTGIGKSSFVKQLAKLLGMNILLIEVPHIVEEHVIQIPFVIFAPNKAPIKSSTGKIDTTDPHIQLATSHLATTLQQLMPISDQEYMASVKSFPPDMMAVYDQLGGTNEKMPQEIANIRRRWHSILFLDEYWRTTSPQVRNILRGILNSKIGDDPLPPGVYVIYASNISDVSGTIEKPDLNAAQRELELPPPTKQELLSHIVGKFPKIKPAIIKAFNNVLAEEHISFVDAEHEIRTSPRRWEQIVLYLNANLPVADQKHAQVLLTNIQAMFGNEHGHISELHKIVDKVVRQLIGQEHGDVKALDATDWRKTLENQIATKKKLGSARSYVPVISGPPGIGKTSEMAQIAKNQNLILITVDAQTLSPESLLGIPLPKTTEVDEANKKPVKQKQLSVSFSPAALYQNILNQVETTTRAWLNNPNISQQAKDVWRKQKYKYLLFIDEFNRVSSPKVFNSLRRVVLDKEFDHNHKVPDNMIIVSAMNPKDDKNRNVQDITGHMKDAIDIITSAPSWTSWTNYLNHDLDQALDLSNTNKQILDLAKKIVTQFGDSFGHEVSSAKISPKSRQFYLRVTDRDDAYISPRDYTDLYANLVAKLKRANNFDLDPAQQIAAAFQESLKNVLARNDIDSPAFLEQVNSWIDDNTSRWYVRERASVTIGELLDACLEDPQHHLKDDIDFQNYVDNYEKNTFTNQLINYIDELVERENTAYHIWAKKQTNKKIIENGKIKVVDDLVSKTEAIHLEIYNASEFLDISNDMKIAFNETMISAVSILCKKIDIPDEVIDAHMHEWFDIFSNWVWEAK